jgi:uncharacterized protein YjbI with pentapeptide repeats
MWGKSMNWIALSARSGRILFAGPYGTYLACLEAGVQQGRDFSGLVLRHENLRGANLDCAKLQGADLTGCDLTSANLAEADLRDCYLNGATLVDTCLAEADLRGASLLQAHLGATLLAGAHLENAAISLPSLWHIPFGELGRAFPMVVETKGGQTIHLNREPVLIRTGGSVSAVIDGVMVEANMTFSTTHGYNSELCNARLSGTDCGVAAKTSIFICGGDAS